MTIIINPNTEKVKSIHVDKHTIRIVVYNLLSRNTYCYMENRPTYTANASYFLSSYKRYWNYAILDEIDNILYAPLKYFCASCIYYNMPIHGDEIHCAVNPTGHRFECDDFESKFEKRG